MTRDKLNLEQIADSVVQHIRRLPTDKVFGMIKVKIQDGKPHLREFTDSKLAKEIK